MKLDPNEFDEVLAKALKRVSDGSGGGAEAALAGAQTSLGVCDAADAGMGRNGAGGGVGGWSVCE